MIPFVDLKEQYSGIKTEIGAAIQSVLESGQFSSGNHVAAFESEFAEYCGSRYGIGLNSGTSALHLAMLAAGVGLGDEVITVSFTFVATVAAICYAGASPVLIDIDPKSFTMDADQLEDAITERTKAIIPVHLYGQPAYMDRIVQIAHRHRVAVIEDAAQAHGAEYNGRRAGSMGDIGCFSFYPSKNLGAYGEGGMVVTDNPEYAETIRRLRDWGQDQRYNHIMRGYNYRMDELQGAVLRVKLRHLDLWTDARRAHAALYDRLLADTGVETPNVIPNSRHVYHIYAIRTGQREALRQLLHEKGVQTGIHYPIPVHLQEAYSNLGYHPGTFPHAETAAREVLSLPMFAELKEEQIRQIAVLLHSQ
jgi:dTDP-4-amino-4,6-dideoxygalactose transaminase